MAEDAVTSSKGVTMDSQATNDSSGQATPSTHSVEATKEQASYHERTLAASESSPGHIMKVTCQTPIRQISRTVAVALPSLLAIIPLVVLAAYSGDVSRKLGYNGCLPNGDFVLPFTSNIWDLRHFFLITLAFGSPVDECAGPMDDYFAQRTGTANVCGGYSFTTVKVIDVAWDLLVGRGGQCALAVAAYRLFRRVLHKLMQGEEIGYDLFAALAFHSGSSSSLNALSRHITHWAPVPRTLNARVAYLAMALSTVYIAAMPTLFSAMTGYTSSYAPSLLTLNEDVGSDDFTAIDCKGTLLPTWGLLQSGPFSTATPCGGSVAYNATPISYNHPPQTDTSCQFLDYYHRYKHIYDQCPKELNISSCEAANIKTWVYDVSPGYTLEQCSNPNACWKLTLDAPMPGIVPFAQNPRPNIPYGHWTCDYETVATWNISMFTQPTLQHRHTATAICQAGNRYVWGFSFLLTFAVCIIQLLFVLVMYGLWFYACYHSGQHEESSQLKDAVMMVTQAQQQHEEDIAGWSAQKLKKRITKGQRGVTLTREDASEADWDAKE